MIVVQGKTKHSDPENVHSIFPVPQKWWYIMISLKNLEVFELAIIMNFPLSKRGYVIKLTFSITSQGQVPPEDCLVL